VRRLAGIGLAAVLLLAAGASLVVWRGFENLSQGLPTVAGLRDYHPSLMSRVYDKDGNLIGELATERRVYAPYSAIPALVQNAFVAAEDQNFWTHNGVDPMAILRAAATDLANYHSGRRPIGASTITQQVAKNMILGNVLTMQRKIKEALLAMRIEQTLSKQKILEIYLNEIYLGLGAYGIASASQTYFDKPLDQLTVAEAAFLGALPKGPNNYNPYRYPVAAKARRDWVIDRMVDTRAITPAMAAAAKAEPLVPAVAHRPPPVPGADWFTEEVHRRLVDRFGDEATDGGLTVQTSLDPKLQTMATDALRRGLLAYDRSHGLWRGPVTHLEGFAQVELEHRHARTADAEPAAPSWEAALTRIPRPPGMLQAWTLGVVLSETPTTARVGWLDEPGGEAGPPAASHVASMDWADTSWARTERGAPRRMADIVRPGDVVMVELVDAGKPGERMMLRQVPKVEGALVSLDPTTGRVLAMVGGWSMENSVFDRATQAQRQPGSSFKPFVYLAAMEKGISPSQKFLDGPFSMGNWRPENYEMDYNGMTALHDALRQSLNLVTIRLASHIGMTAVADTAIAFHEVDSMPKVLPAALGAVDTTVLREAGAYASLAENGREVVPSLIDSVEDRDGHVVWQPDGFALAPGDDPDRPPALVDNRKQIADPASTFQVVTMMEDVVKRGTGTQAGAGIDRPIAGKTGTSQDFNDAWFVGFTPSLVTAVWVGFDQPASLGDKETGGAVAGPIWNNFMKGALGDGPVLQFRVPAGITLSRYNTGMGETVDAFKDGQVPGQSNGLDASNAIDANEMTLGPQDNGAELEATMPPPENGGAGGPAAPGAPGSGTVSASSSDAARPPPQAPAGGNAAGSDIGVGGVY
jgi:penicillin-binding protein 1A